MGVAEAETRSPSVGKAAEAWILRNFAVDMVRTVYRGAVDGVAAGKWYIDMQPYKDSN